VYSAAMGQIPCSMERISNLDMLLCQLSQQRTCCSVHVLLIFLLLLTADDGGPASGFSSFSAGSWCKKLLDALCQHAASHVRVSCACVWTCRAIHWRWLSCCVRKLLSLLRFCHYFRTVYTWLVSCDESKALNYSPYYLFLLDARFLYQNKSFWGSGSVMVSFTLWLAHNRPLLPQ